MKTLFTSLALIALLFAGCTAMDTASAPAFHAYSEAVKQLEPNVTTLDEMKALYGNYIKREEIQGGFRCVWQDTHTAVRSTSSGAYGMTDFDPGRSVGRYTYSTTYISTLTAAFTNDNILRKFNVSNSTK